MIVEKKNLMKLAGTVAPIITVFNDDESLNEEKTIKHARWLIDNGVQGLVVCGSTGESLPMTKDERKRLAEAIMKEFINDVPVCIGTGCYRTADTIELTKNAKDLGADSVLIIPPYYMGVTKIQVFEHFKAIAKSVDIPIILYNNPSATGILISVQELKNYWDLGIINGVKLTIDNPSYVHELRYHLSKTNFSLFYGADICALEGLLSGAIGWISGIPNLIPKLSRELCDAALSGKRDKAIEIWEKMLPLILYETYLDENREPHWLSLLKSGLEVIGHNVGKPRRPILPLNKKHKELISDILSEF